MSLPPAQPAYIFRGHSAQIHATAFVRANTRLVTGDADGWIVLWDMATRRAAAVWRAHQGAILGVAEWGENTLLTHGKDDKLIVWKLRKQDEADMSVALPVDSPGLHRKQPWILHMLHVNTLNFCSFAHCRTQSQLNPMPPEELTMRETISELLVAFPNTISSESVDIFHLPSERRLHTVPGDETVKTGMVMAVSIFYSGAELTVVTGFESGHTTVSQLFDGHAWHILYMSQPHSQPILSLAVDPNHTSYVTSSADAVIAKHPIPSVSREGSRSGPTVPPPASGDSQDRKDGTFLLSKRLVSVSPPRSKTTSSLTIVVETQPLRTAQTKHSGQQGLKVRCDSKIFATAGWDSRVRVYSLHSLKELAVLKWHKEGCYTVAFADISSSSSSREDVSSTTTTAAETENMVIEERSMTASATAGAGALLSVKEKRDLKATATHWLAAGSKDGKVSLWDIY